MSERVPRVDGLAICMGDCGRMTKPARWGDDREPGVQRRYSKGMCGRCLDRFHRRVDVPTVKSRTTPERMEQTIAGLESFMRLMRANSDAVKERRIRARNTDVLA